jgi:hypothetical protein
VRTDEPPAHKPDVLAVVMVIEDDVAVGEVMGVLLEDAGYGVVLVRTAPSVHEVRRRSRSRDP